MNISKHRTSPLLLLSVLFLWVLSPVLTAGLPSNYDLRDFGWITPTKDQGPLGTCWAFASTTAFQSSALRHGVVSGPTNPALDVSIWHLATHNGVGEPDLTYPYNDWGGDNYYTEGYLARGRGEWSRSDSSLTIGGGYVDISSDPLNAYPIAAVQNQENLSPYVPPVDQPLAGFRLQSSFNYYYTEAGAPDIAHRQALQSAIMERGAVSATMWAGGDTPETYFDNFYNSTHNTFMVTGAASSENANHLIILAGWDDNQPVYDAGGSQISTGAWLVQNSWGDDWADDGYFWIAYDDPIATKEADSFIAADRSVPGQPGMVFTETVLQNQIFTQHASWGAGSEDPSLATSRLTFTDSYWLAGIGMWSNESELEFSLSIFSDWNDGPETLLFTDDYTVLGIGYKEIYFDPMAFDEEDEIFVMFDFGTGYSAPVAIDTLSMMLEGMDSFLGLSWVSVGDDVWLDLGDDELFGGIFFTKGLTAIPEPATITLLFGLAAVLLIIRRQQRQ